MLRENLRVALRALAANKLRSVLTTLGIVIGVAAVIALVAAGNGVRQYINQQLEAQGANLVYVFPARINISGGANRSGFLGGNPSARSGIAASLTEADATAMNDRSLVPDAAIIAPVASGAVRAYAGSHKYQARIRGTLIMALSNKFGWLVLTTGNKSEFATGYCTLYGDMAGGFAVIKDVPKTLVFDLCRWRNKQGVVIPPSTIDRPPTAELRPDQKDSDSLPPYDMLDPILEAYVEKDMGVAEMLAAGFDEAAVRKAVRLVDLSEYKRRQGPPGIKITPKAFGRDRRMPITNRYCG